MKKKKLRENKENSEKGAIKSDWMEMVPNAIV